MRVQVTYRCHGAAERFKLRAFTATPAPCCPKMAAEWGELVDVSLCGFPAARNIKPVIFVLSTLVPGESEVVTAAMQISYCPWCGQQIEVVDGGLDTSSEEGETKPVPELNF